jgi:type III pantothenate kinase
MKQSLASGTEQLPYTDACFPLGLATNTAAAIHSGTLYAAVGLIEKIIGIQTEPFKLFLTGGDAAVIAAALTLEVAMHEDLVLWGLLAVAEAEGL